MITPTLDEAFARALVDAAPDALVVCDAKGRIVLINVQAERLFGYPPGELIGQPIEMLVPERHRDAHLGERTRFTEQPAARPMGSGRRLTGRRRDGSVFPAEVSLSPVHAEHGLFIAAAVRDVTEQRRTEEALAAAEARLRDLVEQAPDGVMVSDLEGRYTQVNSAACRLLGYAREELEGMTITDLLAPEDWPRLVAERAHLATPGAVAIGEWNLRRKDGAFVPVEVSAKILSGGRWQALVRDISARKILEREHHAMLERLRIVLEQCPVGIVLLTRRQEGVEIELNERGKALLQRPATDIRPGQYTGFITHLDGAALSPEEAPTRRTLRGEHVDPIDLMVTRPDGSRFPIQARGAPLLDAGGEVVGGIVAFEDVTAERDLERLRTEWNAIVAHDLRNPLNVIVLHARLLARSARGRPELTDSIEEIQTAAARMSRMIHDLLDLSRLEAKKLSLRRDPIELARVVQRAVDAAALSAPDRAFEVRALSEIPSVLADPDRVTQVLDNLLSNAVKYGAAGSPVIIAMERSGALVEVAVTNEGAGLSEESVAQLFQRFHRTPEGRLAGVKGIGLGLYIARELVEAHGGQIAVESVRDGKTTFRFTLPVA